MKRSEAKAQGLKRYFTGKSCPRGHIVERLVSNGDCCACNDERSSRLHRMATIARREATREIREAQLRVKKAASAERKRLRDIARYPARREERLKYNKKYYKENAEKIKKISKRWADANVELVRSYKKKYQNGNYEKFVALQQKRLVHCLPKWLTKKELKQIRQLYRIAREMSKITGIKHHVDHVIPINGETVCGLHVPSNLQILTAAANAAKSNKYVSA